jgi:hypothetical protein
VAGRVNHPAKSLFLFALVGAAGWWSYEYLHKRNIFASSDAHQPVDDERKEQIRELVLDEFGQDECFLELGPLSYRYKEGSYRIDFVVADGCEDRAKALCERISERVEDEYRLTAQVWAFGSGGREIARWVP